MMSVKTLIFVPTYNEVENAVRMFHGIHKLGLDADVLFMDDNSPDGTGESLERIKPQFPRLFVQRRSGRLGIGSAHMDGIAWAYANGYTMLVTLDCDFTHSPLDIPAMISAANEGAMAVGSRWMRAHSLPGWNIFRRFMTSMGHLLTKRVLGLPYDASGAFRAYRLDIIPREIFALVLTKGYSFFFESLFILYKNQIAIKDVAITLPSRTYGSSKMTCGAAWRSGCYIFTLFLANLRRPEQFLLKSHQLDIDSSLKDPQGWDTYWENSQGHSGVIYDIIAAFYRQTFIKRNIERVVFREFPNGSKMLHGGCGSGQADTGLAQRMRITALDISQQALHLYGRNNPNVEALLHGNILRLSLPDSTFDGYYNMGVVEHFTHDEIRCILREAYRVLKPGGKAVIFWPHARATSVFVLHIWHWVLHHIIKKKVHLHPPEISLLRSQEMAESLLGECGFELRNYQFDSTDFFIQAVIVAQKR